MPSSSRIAVDKRRLRDVHAFRGTGERPLAREGVEELQVVGVRGGIIGKIYHTPDEIIKYNFGIATGLEAAEP